MSPEESLYMEKNRQSASVSQRVAVGSDMKRFAIAAIALALCFYVPLYRLFRFAMATELYSYVILMPVVTLYLLRIKKPIAGNSGPLTWVGALFFLAGIATLGIYFAWVRPMAGLEMEDYLSVTMLSFFLCLMGLAGLILDRKSFYGAAFPLAMLIFMVPMPAAMLDSLEEFLQYGSAWAAAGFFKATFSTFSLSGLDFALPGTPGLRVAPECSGIHSSWILLITSLLAGYLFLKSPWHRAILAFVVLPLALFRNGFRIFVIGELCVHISPKMIDSYIHRKGGPIFFVLSLIPFFLILVWLRRRERIRERDSSV